MALSDSVPSSAIDVLKRNSEDFDKVTNDAAASVTTRTGKKIITLEEYARRFNETLANLGLEYPPIDYVAGLTVERNTQVYRYNNVLYINTRQDLPFTTTGAFDEGGWQIVQQVNQSTVIFSSDGIKGLDAVALIDRAAYSVSGFYAGTEVGGGDFIYDANRDKADHNGGAVITPEAIAAWDGTQANLSVLLDWTGTGTGAFVRIHSIPLAVPQVNPEWWGAIADGIEDDSDPIISAVSYLRSKRGGCVYLGASVYSVTKTIDLFRDSAMNIKIKGQSTSSTVVKTTQDITVFLHAETCDFDSFTIEQAGTAKTGRAFSTPTNKQSAYCTYNKLLVKNFKYGAWWRYSLWNTVKDTRFEDCACSVKGSRNALPDDQTNPDAPGSWNSGPGFFHNQNTFQNVLCDGGEVGIWGTFNGNVFDNVTCQNQIDSSGASNVALPAGMQGTGLWLQGSESAVGSRFGSQSNLISNYYSEFTRQPMIFDRAQAKLESFYVQGGASADKYPQAIKAINGAVVLGGDCASAGTDWFDNQVLATDSTLFGNIGAGVVNGGVSSLTNSVWQRSRSAGAGENKTFSVNASATNAVGSILPQSGVTKVYATVIQGGSFFRRGEWIIYYYNGSNFQVVADTTNTVSATITVSGEDIIYTNTDSVNQLVVSNVINLNEIGNTNGNGLYSS